MAYRKPPCSVRVVGLSQPSSLEAGIALVKPSCVDDLMWVDDSGLSLSIERANVFFSSLIHLDQVVSADKQHWSPNLVSYSVSMNVVTYIHELTNM